MPKTRNSKHRKHRKHRNHRNHSKKLKNKAGTLQSFRGTKVALANLEQRGIDRVLSNKIFREFSASTIQDTYREKNLRKISALLNQYRAQFLTTERSLLHAINIVRTNYEFNDEENMLPLLNDTLTKVRRIVRLYNDPQFLQEQLKEQGFETLKNEIMATISRLTNVRNLIRKYVTNESLDDYRMSQLGVELQPSLRNTTTRREEAIVRPAKINRPRNYATISRKRATSH